MKNRFLILILSLLISSISLTYAQTDDTDKNTENNSECLRRDFTVAVSPNHYFSIYGRTNYFSGPTMFFSTDKPVEIYFNFEDEVLPGQTSMQLCYLQNIDSFACSITPQPKFLHFNKQMKCFSWAVTSADIGEFDYTIRVSTKYHTEEIPVKIRIVDDWTSGFIPNVAYSYFAPKNKSVFGKMMGGSIQFDLVSWAHHNDNKGPSHGKFYLRFDYLESDKDSLGVAFKYCLGAQVSFERNANRSYLVPFYGVEMGGIYQREIGSLFLFNPHIGLWCYSNRNFNVSAMCGYMLPTQKVDDFSGLFASLSLGFSLW